MKGAGTAGRGENGGSRARITRRAFLGAAAFGAAWAALSGAVGCAPGRFARTLAPAAPSESMWAFRSSPDLRPPTIEVSRRAGGTAPGRIFLAPKNGPGEYAPGQHGPLIVDDEGRPVWFRPLQEDDEDAFDFKVQRYRGEPVLTWWEGRHSGYGKGEYAILDTSYREVARVRAGNSYLGDHHEFLITSQDTALLTIYEPVRVDLSSLGGPEDGVVLDGIVQEVDIETGEVLFEWHSLDHVALEESYEPLPEDPGRSFDYFHINSVDVDHDGHLLVSARKTSAVYKVDRFSGEVLWRLDGKRGDFEMGPGTQSYYQHDARRRPDGNLTIFDNGDRETNVRSRGIVVELDEEAMTATLVREYYHPAGRLAATQGNMQGLPNGNVFVGWGSDPAFSEFTGDGELLFNADFSPGVESYRAFRMPWSGHPDDHPAVVAERGPAAGEVTIYASWNGATEVAAWRVLAGESPNRLSPLGILPRDGFETVIAMRTDERYVRVQATDASGKVLGASAAVEPDRPAAPGPRRVSS